MASIFDDGTQLIHIIDMWFNSLNISYTIQVLSNLLILSDSPHKQNLGLNSPLSQQKKKKKKRKKKRGLNAPIYKSPYKLCVSWKHKSH